MRNTFDLFVGERSLTLGAALFDHFAAAARAAGLLQRRQEGERCAVLVVEPGDPRLGRKMAPASTDTEHPMLRAYGKLGVVGLALGALVGAFLAWDTVWPAAMTSPLTTIGVAAVYGLLAGLLTLRPDRSAWSPRCAKRRSAGAGRWWRIPGRRSRRRWRGRRWRGRAGRWCGRCEAARYRRPAQHPGSRL